MRIARLSLMFGLALIVSSPVFAAEDINEKIDVNGQYWQRVSVSSQIYQRGPKAQQMLGRDIARCVVELRELERQGVVKDAIPAYVDDRVLSQDEMRLAGWDTPERDEHLFSENADYYDFEGCMLAKGWERVKYVPYDVAIESRENYIDAHVNAKEYAKQRSVSPKYESEDDYDGLND